MGTETGAGTDGAAGGGAATEGVAARAGVVTVGVTGDPDPTGAVTPATGRGDATVPVVDAAATGLACARNLSVSISSAVRGNSSRQVFRAATAAEIWPGRSASLLARQASKEP